MQGFVEVNEFSETILHTVIYSEKASLEHASEWCDQVPLFCPDPSRPSFHPVEVAAETTSALVPSPYKRPSGEVVYIDQSPSKRNHSASVVTSSSSSSASAAGAIAASLSDVMLDDGLPKRKTHPAQTSVVCLVPRNLKLNMNFMHKDQLFTYAIELYHNFTA